MRRLRNVIFPVVAVMGVWIPVSAWTDGGVEKVPNPGSQSRQAPEGDPPGAPTLETVTDTGDGMAHLVWSNSAATPLQFLGFAFDLYASDWVKRFWEGTLWAPFPAGAASGDMDLAFTGGYYVWISNQYGGGNWYPCNNPWGGIMYSGKPHTPRNLVAQRQRSANVRLKWKPDLYGTWQYQMCAYKDGEGFVDTLGPGGISRWHFVDYGGAAYGEYEASFSEGWADFWLPWGTYWFFICGVGWLPPNPTGNYVWASATVLPERTFDLPGDVQLRMIRLPSGSFQMGSPDAERSRLFHEGPVHEVTIDPMVHLGKYEVTQQQWMAVMGANPAYGDNGVGDNYPVYYVSWNDCQQFIDALNALGLGGVFRLPSEAEWEYACRAGTETRFFFGDSLGADDGPTDAPAGTLPDNRSDYMWYWFNSNGDANGAYGSHPHGTKLPNNFQFFDMGGNVWEWCQDWYHPSYENAPVDGSAWEAPAGTERVIRGGSWYDFANGCRSAYRDNNDPADRDGLIGLRLAWTPI